MAFKMKAGKEGPMKKNFPSVFKNDPTKVKVFGGGMNVDISTKKGRDILKEIKNIPTVSSTEPGRVKNPKVTTTKLGQKIFKTIGKIGGKALMGGIIDPFSSNDPRVTRSLLSKPAPKGGA